MSNHLRFVSRLASSLTLMRSFEECCPGRIIQTPPPVLFQICFTSSACIRIFGGAMFGSYQLIETYRGIERSIFEVRKGRGRAGNRPASEALELRAGHALTLLTNPKFSSFHRKPTLRNSWPTAKSLVCNIPGIQFDIGRVSIHFQISIGFQSQKGQNSVKSGDVETIESRGGFFEVAEFWFPELWRGSEVGQPHLHLLRIPILGF